MMSVMPVVVNFRRLIVEKELDSTAVDGVLNRDLLHAVVALYDQSLPDVTSDIIYSHVCRSASKTLLFIRDKEGVLQEVIKKGATEVTDIKQNDVTVGTLTGNGDLCQGSSNGKGINEDEKQENGFDNEDQNAESSDEEPGLFDDVYSDTCESSDDSNESTEEEEDLSIGSKEFVASVKRRRALRNAGKFTDDCVGIESRLAGAASIERLVGKDEQGVLQLSLIAVRKRYRRRGLGRRLLNMVKETSISGNCSSIIAYVDHAALQFFRKHGFTDDVIISSKFKHIAEHWENSTFMCYLPPFSDLKASGTSTAAQDVAAVCLLENDISEWKQMNLEAQQKLVVMMERTRHQLLEMSVKIRTQDETISQLQQQVNELGQEKEQLAKELDDYRQISHSSFKSAVAAISERFLDLAIPDSKCDGTREMHNEVV
ncbi:uncharacterized protein LOC134186012 isoform X2 [Corticium candelabrum]|uniref:uncharacterized protein LOC134186012 isoform X2 n=1 Tax=Corticium candelabrum TaxID=121492 RepID=UPI002E255918|nr:uncharacterized protein LOC134186012 isoform X2 [Corticium candelabrum]